ncbi:hypothetical protein KBY70_06170 [Cyanobium sp. ATX 6E8]|uniref:hypothetical protein n=1 Tax=Cyanobium sp. ATX 6E8 TaxID=2823701 RepID=UPI0020CE10D3|nr:hypothetical protein [Cyanobium sp. ATX 6E8]MCP9941973.1 hypothetical protein [Cyanobium sp. ATX 6E8]
MATPTWIDTLKPMSSVLMRLSILVVSRTARLLNRFLDSLNQACSLDPLQTEVLCSWNGSAEEERCITNTSRYDFHIAQHIPYHFASNINGLIQKSNADLVMIANDDLILDPQCVNAGVETLESRSEIGLVGAVLRTESGTLSHAGINFDARGSAYHILDQLVPADQPTVAVTGPVAAVTGALQWIRRADALNQPLNEQYRVCGEDVELCLDVQQHLGKQVWLCAEAHAIHEAESTREHDPDQAANSEDLLRLRSRYHNYLAQASTEQLRRLLDQQQSESLQLRGLIQQRHAQLDEHHLALEMELQRLRQDARAIEDLQEERLRLKALLERSPAAFVRSEGQQ